ncbi:tetratricopeptide repeat protein [Myroides sp. M-43]|uniref:tetratricopeptide repeat protein n=1 Tax=Myroides oncorhynchi TaxID=2893756 RepID=UPI001E2F9D26|nr:tetratricopeptide repeat protein [Myroides oncorhynchi]MCC9043100.1 tetratricopeptide repeat protein [Myroides oncorhynchi]
MSSDDYNQFIEKSRIDENSGLELENEQLLSNDENIELIYNLLSVSKSVEGDHNIDEDVVNKLNDIVSDVESQPNIGLRLWVYNKIGSYFYFYSDYVRAAPFFLEISRVIDTDFSLLDVQTEEVLLKTAYFFETVGKLEKAEEYYRKIIDIHQFDTSKDLSAVYYSLAYTLFKKGNLDAAESYFYQSKTIALKFNNQLRYAKILGGLGELYEKRKDIVSAKEFMLENIELSSKLNDDRNYMFSYLIYAKLLFNNQEFNLAKMTFLEAYSIANKMEYQRGFQVDILKYLALIARTEGDGNSELEYIHEIGKISEQTEKKEGELIIKEINWKADYDRINWRLQSKQDQLDKLWYQRLLLFSSSILLVVIVIIIVLFYKRVHRLQAFKYEAKLYSFQLDKIKSENKLNDTSKTLASYQTYLSEKNEQIANLEQELLNLRDSSEEYFKKNKPVIEDLLSSHLMTEENWRLFVEAFANEQSEYLEYLNNHFPDLTDANMRIILLQKIGLTNQETANILGVTIDAVKKAKQRLKKKYETDYELIFSEK